MLFLIDRAYTRSSFVEVLSLPRFPLTLLYTVCTRTPEVWTRHYRGSSGVCVWSDVQEETEPLCVTIRVLPTRCSGSYSSRLRLRTGDLLGPGSGERDVSTRRMPVGIPVDPGGVKGGVGSHPLSPFSPEEGFRRCHLCPTHSCFLGRHGKGVRDGVLRRFCLFEII